MFFSRKFLALLLVLVLFAVACGDDDDDNDDHSADDDAADDDSTPADDDDDSIDDDDDDDDDTPPPLTGVYAVSGEDEQYGAYSGWAEIYETETGVAFARTIEYAAADFEGDAVASAWSGEVTGDLSAFVASASLERIGFMTAYDDFTRDVEEVDPLPVSANFAPTGKGAFSGTFTGGETISATETWTWTEANGDAPIWTNQRQRIATHAPLSDGLHNLLFAVFGGFIDREEMDPYRDREDFQSALHTIFFDPTDFDFYRANPNVLRVIQKVIDPVSLAETRLRNRAYRQTLAEKAAYFDADMHARHINGAGMINASTGEGDDLVFHDDMSSMLWTGVYIGSQALRYLATGEAEALEHVVTCARGQVLAYDIVPEVGAFARSLRVHDENMPGGWAQGEAPYENYDYLPGGNNDMLHGYQIGFLFAGMVLLDNPGYADLVDDMIRVLAELEEHHPDAADGMINEMKMNMLLYYLDGDSAYRQRYRQLLNNFFYDLFLEELGNGSFYIYGISDWSGNHLNAQSMIVLTWLAELLEDDSLAELRHGCQRAYWMMHGPRLPLFLTTMAAMGWDEPDAARLEEGLWRLREFPTPKTHTDIDWEINPGFSLSPFPSLPWKFDWWTSNDRFFSLYGYPLFEQGVDNFMFRNSPFGYRDGASERSEFSAEYLYVYWLLYQRGLITGDE
ncbi:MAG TPA: hypothetical protein PKW95_13480 [bacterium]|nr:hypothetical protein [bacterium]